LFCPKWLYGWLWPFFLSMWTHCSRSCSTFDVTFVFYILIPNVGKIVWRHRSHYNRWGDLLFNCSHISYLV
jgi:hypothetical protein